MNINHMCGLDDENNSDCYFRRAILTHMSKHVKKDLRELNYFLISM